MLKLNKNINFIIQFSLRDVKNRYVNSNLGIIWSVITPLIMIILYATIFSNILNLKLGILNNKFSYVNYLCIGIITWNFLSEFLIKSLNIFRENSNLIKKLNFFKIYLIIANLISSLFNFTLALTIFLVFLIFYQKDFNNINFYLFIIIFLSQIIFIFSLGLCLSLLNVFIPDTEHFFKIFIQIWFWASPIVYPISIIPESVKNIFFINPFYHFLKYYHEIFVFKNIVSINYFDICLLYFYILFFLSISLYLYKKIKDAIVDEI